MALMATPMAGGGTPGGLCEKAGELAFSELIKQGQYNEDLTSTNTSSLYVTILRSMVRQAPAPPTFIRDMFQLNTDMIGTVGSGAIKLAKNKLARGTKQGESGSIEYETDGYESVTVTPDMYAAASALTRNILQFAGPGLVTQEAMRMRRAIELAIEYYGIAAINAACSDANANSHDNQIETGGGSTDMDYADILAAREVIETYHGQATDIIVHPADYNALLTDTDIKDALKYASITTNAKGEIISPLENILDMKVHKTAYQTDGTAHVIDRNNLGAFVQASEIEVADIPVANSFNQAVGAYMFFGFGIENADMVAEIVKA